MEEKKDKFLAPENEVRQVSAPDGSIIEVDPLKDYFSQEKPEPYKVGSGPVENFLNWARAESLWVLGFGTGCGSIEIPPLVTPRFDMYRFGVQMRATPRQSNVFIISGYLAIKTLKRAIRAYEQMPSPKYIVALGSCTINGGMYYDSYNTINRLDQYLPVDAYIAGCMPRPEALLAGFAELKKLIKAGKGHKANEYVENLEWYKTNQKKIIKDWNMPDYNW
ncbi:MAG: NADH-quinone oxidoreductase subunit NuoB [Ichthyobacteriaceae bacterium]|nr:NADH-quinone oxidoreductase subunit NuoB [Ichthyobacteriaceae bacterium]